MNNELSVELTLDTERYKSDLAEALKIFNRFQKELSSRKLGLNKNQIREFDSIFTDIKNTAIRELNTIQNKINSLELKSDKLEASWDRALRNLDTSLPEEKWNEALGKVDEIEVKYNVNEEELTDARDNYKDLMELLQENPLEMQYTEEPFAKFNIELDNVADGLTKSGQKMDELKKKSLGLSSIFGRLSIAGRVFSQMRTSIATMLNPLNHVRRLWSDIIMADGSNLGNTFKTVGENIKNYLTPILQKVAVAILNVISYFAQMISIITGKKIDLFKKSKDSTDKIKKNMAGTAASAKQVNKQLAGGFDEITDISESVSGGGGGGASLSPLTQDIDFKFKEPKLPKVLENIAKFVRDHPKLTGILAGLTAFTFLGGFKVSSGIFSTLSKVLGKGGTGKLASGASGLLGIIGTMALIAATVVICKITYDKVKEAVQAYKDMKAAQEEAQRVTDNGMKKSTTRQQQIMEETRLLAQDDEQRKRNIDTIIKMIDNNDTYVHETLKGRKVQKGAEEEYNKELGNVALGFNEMLLANEMTEDEQYKYYKFLKTYLTPEQLDNAEQLGLTAEQAYNLKNGFKDLDQKFETKYKLDAETSAAKSKFDTFVNNISTRLSKPIEFKLKANIQAMSDSVKRALKMLGINSFAVGTNYVPNDQLAYIHQGEAIVPKKFNDKQFFTSYSSNDETNNLLEKLITAVNNIEINPYTTVKDIGNTAVQYIKDKSRQEGRSVI